MNGVKVNHSANRVYSKCFRETENYFPLICSENSGNTGNSSNIRKKNPAPTLSKSGWECGAGGGTRLHFLSRERKKIEVSPPSSPAATNTPQVCWIELFASHHGAK